MENDVANAPWDVEVYYDGECPFCIREINLLRRWDRQQRISFVDISADDFDPAFHGKEMDALMAEIHARLPSGQWITGVEVFRRLYAAAGLSPLVAMTRLPIISHALEVGYRLFAKNRLRITGRCSTRAKTCQNPV